eukprot:TRINITY_DN15383_c0_g1_i1.p2 TRINITY_DN15383_c0_g1~~TRINITY_DN15383_c0_g1_i1.p2  ORF type:complete len:107 (-),score=28.59 TRINITY_DN15383_c0_g1_i1:62-355(-)
MAAIPAGIAIGEVIAASWPVLLEAAVGLGVALGIVYTAKTAGDIIGETKKGSINREFPEEWRNKTPEEIEKAAKSGDKSAQKAKKLLNDKRFDKDKK